MSAHPLFSVDPVLGLPGPVPKNRLDKTRGGGQQPSITPRSYSRGPHPRYLGPTGCVKPQCTRKCINKCISSSTYTIKSCTSSTRATFVFSLSSDQHVVRRGLKLLRGWLSHALHHNNLYYEFIKEPICSKSNN